MDAHSRGQADEVDPADQWVLNPHTGDYELRPDRSAAESSRAPGPRTRRDRGHSFTGARRDVPAQRNGGRARGNNRKRKATRSSGSIDGAAGATVTWLQSDQGVPEATNKANAPAKTDTTTLVYAPDQADQARALADMMGLPAPALKQGTTDAGEQQATVLTLGADFKGAGVPVTGPAKAPDIPKASADKAECAK